MEIGIVGFEKSGKTTAFNALTGSSVSTSAFGGGKIEPNIAIVNLPDERLDKLNEMSKSKKLVYATVKYTDLPGTAKDSVANKQGLDPTHIQYLGQVDSLIAVIRAFEDDSGIETNIEGDIESMNIELLLSDLVRVETRLERLEKGVKKLSGVEKDKQQKELDLITKIKAWLDENKPIRDMELDEEEKKLIRGFQFLSEKPILYLLNISEDMLLEKRDLAGEIKNKLNINGKWEDVAQMSCEVEMEISQLEQGEREIFMKDYGITEPASKMIIRRTFDLLGYMTYLTTGEKETHAWTLKKGSKAPQAAGVIHSDFERGFIRAEIINWKDLLDLGGYPAAKKAGKLRLEGKEYVVQDGDTIIFLFNV